MRNTNLGLDVVVEYRSFFLGAKGRVVHGHRHGADVHQEFAQEPRIQLISIRIPVDAPVHACTHEHAEKCAHVGICFVHQCVGCSVECSRTAYPVRIGQQCWLLLLLPLKNTNQSAGRTSSQAMTAQRRESMDHQR